MKKSKQFTIIELLVVLAIISLIIGMLLTGISIARESARETRAKAEMQQIKMAVTQYLSTFKSFPTTDTALESSDNKWDTMWTYLNGTENTRKHSFIKGEIKRTPWGEEYAIIMDVNYLNSVNPNDSGFSDAPNEDVADKVALWCKDKDGDILNTWE
ncbi:type II secretion system protein [Lentisphaera profundi]|uniref:Type II secretion system protein n=1 Tax=Lentisphaera profundi TaxID=1658616 RepID=A0ABY7VRN8_9BACT|nr:type II secretion system protein [Lentisphaera profundi]WDE96707.1 type II secretion system protein [Lentisphaera profundi]